MVVKVFETSISGHGFEVGDMVWAKMKSQPWWPGHVYSEEFATPLVRQSKRDGLLLVALFGASSYAWFDPSELIPFDSNYAEKSLQTNAQTFVRAVEDAVVEVQRRISLGMSCMCSNKQNCRKIGVPGFVVDDVVGYDPGALYSVAAIGKARESFRPKLALDFLRQLALEPASGDDVDDIDFIKNKATVMSYRKAVYEDFDELYDQASVQEPAPQETSFKAEPKPMVKVSEDHHHHQPAMENIPPSMVQTTSSVQLKSILKTSGGEKAPGKGGREVFADSLGKVMNTAKPRNHAKKDEYLFKPRNEFIKGNEKVTSAPLLIELGSGKPIMPEKKKQKKDGISLVETFSTKKAGQPKGPQKSDGNYGTKLLRVLDDLHSLAVDPFNTVNRGSCIKGKKAFLRFRSLVFQKGQNFLLPLSGGQPNASKSYEDSVQVPPVQPPSGLKRGLADHHQEEIVAAKKTKAGDIRNLTKEKKVTKTIDIPPARDVKQPVAPLKRPGPELIKRTDQRAPGPMMLTLKFPQGGSLPSYNELKARLAPYGPMDHSGTHIFWNTFSCQVVFRHKAHAQAAYRSVVGNSNLFGNTGVKCTLKEVGTVNSAKPEPPVEVPKENHQQPGMEHRPPSMVPDTSLVQAQSILKKPGGEEAAGNIGRGRVKLIPGGNKSRISNATSFSSRLTMDFSSKNFEKAVHPSVVTSPTGSLAATPPPPPPIHNGKTLLSPPSLLPMAPCSMRMSPLRVPTIQLSDPLRAPNRDITKQMLNLLTRCNDVVTNVSSILGYTPYHPL